ncbi:unnamed protein product [Closterium sp. NIES-54]
MLCLLVLRVTVTRVSGTPPGIAPVEALHTFTLDSGASRCFFRDSTTLTPLPAPVPVRLADPSRGPVVASSSTVLPCPAVPSGSLSGFHLPSFSTNLVSTAALQDAMVTTTTPRGQHVSICTSTRTGRHLATFTRQPGSSLYTLATEPPQVAASAQVSASGQVAASCSCRLLSHQTLLWHHRLGHPSLPRLRGMHSHLLVSGLPRSLPPTLRWTWKVGDASVFRFYHPISRRVLPSQDVTFDESVPFYHLFPFRSAPSPPPPLFLAPGPPPIDPLPPQGPAPSGVSQVDPLPGTAPVQGAFVSSAALGAESGGAASGGAEPGGAGSEGAGSGGAEPEGVELEGAESEGAESRGAESRGAALSGGPAGASRRLSSQQLREWLVQFAHRRSGAPGASEPGGAGAGGAAVTTGVGDPTELRAAGAGGAGAGGPGAGGAGAAGAGAVDPGIGGAGGTERLRPYFVPQLQQVLGVPSSTGLPPPFLCPPLDQSQPPLQPASPLPVPSPYTEQSEGLTECREPASRPVSPIRTARLAPCLHPPPVPGTHTMTLHPSSVPLRVPLPAPFESSLPDVSDPESDRARAASPTVAHLLATAVTDASFESAAASSLVAELLDFAAACRLDYASALVAESVPANPLSVGGECALGTDVLEDKQEDFECLAAAVPRFASLLLAPEADSDAPHIPTPRSYAEAITGPYSSQWQAAMDAEMASWKSTGTYVDEVPPPGVNIVDGMWIFKVKRPPGSSPAFKARYVARGFSQRQGVDYFLTFSPTPKMTTLRVLLHVAAQRDYELYSLDLSAFLQGSLHEEIWLRRPPGFTRTTLAPLGFVPSTADTSLFLRTDTSLPPFYVLVYVDDLVFATADTEALTLVKSELQKRHTCTDLGELRSYLGLQITRDRARRTITLTQSHMVHQVLQRFGFQYSSPQLMAAEALGVDSSSSHASNSHAPLRSFVRGLSSVGVGSVARTSGAQVLRLVSPVGSSDTLSIVASAILRMPGGGERQRAAPHSSSCPPTTAPLQTLHMDVRGPARVRGQDQKYIVLVVDDYTRYTMVFPLWSKVDVREVVSFPPASFKSFVVERASPIMEVACTSMIHAVASHFRWPFSVRYAEHQLNLWPRVFVPETSPTLRWMGEVGNASAFQVRGMLSLVRDTTAGKLSPCTLRCGPAPSGLSQVDPLPLVVPLETSPGFPPWPSLPPPKPVAVDSGPAGGGDTGGVDSRGAGPEVSDSWGAESRGAGSGVADTGDAASPSGGGVVGALAGGSGIGQQQLSRRQETLSPQQLRDRVDWRGWVPGAWSTGAGGARAGGAGGTGVVGAGSSRAGGAGARGTGGTGAAGRGGARAEGAGGTGATGARVSGAGGIGGAGAGGTRGSCYSLEST